MALNLRPFWTDNTTVISAEVAQGNKSSTTLDLQTKRGAWLYVALGRLDTTAITDTPLTVTVRGIPADASINHPNASETRVGNDVTADGSTTIDVDVASGARIVSVAATTNFAKGDLIYIGATDGTRGEFAKVVDIDVGVSLTVDQDIINPHTSAQADAVINQADVFSRIWVAGGSLMAIEANYLAASAGPDIFVSIWAQTYDGDGTPP